MKQIALSQGKFALVDDEDFEWLSQWKWSAANSTHTTYAVRCVWTNGKPKIISMHRLILKPPRELVTDHIDGNGLNNQRKNLRCATKAQNTRNEKCRANSLSGYKGVAWIAAMKAWRAQIKHDDGPMVLGHFKDKVAAAKAYDKAAKEYFGEFARLNFEDVV